MRKDKSYWINDNMAKLDTSKIDLLKEIIQAEKTPIVRYNADYCGYEGTIIKGTKTNTPRGYNYDLVIILKDGDIVFGREQGNYAGGINLSPNHENYKSKRDEYLHRIKNEDPIFYNLIIGEIV